MCTANHRLTLDTRECYFQSCPQNDSWYLMAHRSLCCFICWRCFLYFYCFKVSESNAIQSACKTSRYMYLGCKWQADSKTHSLTENFIKNYPRRFAVVLRTADGYFYVLWRGNMKQVLGLKLDNVVGGIRVILLSFCSRYCWCVSIVYTYLLRITPWIMQKFNASLSALPSCTETKFHFCQRNIPCESIVFYFKTSQWVWSTWHGYCLLVWSTSF